MKSIPKTERIVPYQRSEEERLAIVVEYLSSFVVWCERLDDKERTNLRKKIERLRHPSNYYGLETFLAACEEYATCFEKEEE
jgi:hypothetical protein